MVCPMASRDCGTVLRHPAALIQAAKGSSPMFALAIESRGSHLIWRAVAMTCDEPGRVVAPSKLDEGGPELLDRSERRYPQEVLLQRANETLGDAIAFGFPNKGGRRFDSEASDFGLKIHGHVIGPVIVAQFDPRATLGAMEPKQRVTACRTGSSASKRFADLAA